MNPATAGAFGRAPVAARGPHGNRRPQFHDHSQNGAQRRIFIRSPDSRSRYALRGRSHRVRRDGDGRPDSGPCLRTRRQAASGRRGRPDERPHRLPAAGHDRTGRRVPSLQRPGQPLSPDHQRPGLRCLPLGRGRKGGGARRARRHTESRGNPGVGDRRGREGAGGPRDRRPLHSHRHRQVPDPADRSRDARARVRVHRGLDARLLAGRKRPLPLPGRPLPAAPRDRRAANRRPDRNHVLELARPGCGREPDDHHGRHPGRVRREGERRHQPHDALRPRHERNEGRAVARRRELQDRIRLRVRGRRQRPIRLVRRHRCIAVGPLSRPGVLRQFPQHGQLAARLPPARWRVQGRDEQLAPDGKHRPHGSRRDEPALPRGCRPGPEGRLERLEPEPRRPERARKRARPRRADLRTRQPAHVVLVPV